MPACIPALRKAQVDDGHSRQILSNVNSKAVICFDFTKNQCTRGASCKYSHNVDYIVAVNSQENGICFEFLRNQCFRGKLCRFSHDLSKVKRQAEQTEGDFKNGLGALNICFDFTKGSCIRGASCTYSHNLDAIKSSKNGGLPLPELCWDHARDRCSRGASCRYLHVDKSQFQPASVMSGMPLQVMSARGYTLGNGGSPNSCIVPQMPPQMSPGYIGANHNFGISLAEAHAILQRRSAVELQTGFMPEVPPIDSGYYELLDHVRRVKQMPAQLPTERFPAPRYENVNPAGNNGMGMMANGMHGMGNNANIGMMKKEVMSGMGGGGMVRRGAVASPYRQPLGQLLPATNTMENNQMGTGYFLPYTPPPPPKMADQSPPQSLSPASSDASLLYMCREIWGMDSSFLQSSV